MNIELEEVQLREQLLNIQAKKEFKKFIFKTFPEYDFNWHHDFLIDKLERFYSGEIKKLMVFLPPQNGKSEICSRRFPAYALGRNPNLKIASCSYNATFASKFNRDVQRIIDSEEYRDVFPETTLSGKNVRSDAHGSYTRNSDEFEIVNYSGAYKSVGVGGGITGITVDIGIIDDPIKGATEANSEVFRNRIWEWYLSEFKTRLHKKSQQLIILTRWHFDDLAGRILKAESDKWDVVSFPAIKENEENEDDPREVGQILWPSKHSIEAYEDIQKASSNVWSSLFQQRPKRKGGNIIKREWFVPYDTPIQGASHFFIDSAYTDDAKNDRTAIMKYKIRFNKLYIENVIAVRKTFPDLIKFLKAWLPANGYGFGSHVKVEPKASGKSIVQQMKSETDFDFKEGIPPSESKETRANAKSPFIEGGNCFYLLGEYNEEFFDEVEGFPNFPTDDMVDVLLGGIDDIDGGDSNMHWVGTSFS